MYLKTKELTRSCPGIYNNGVSYSRMSCGNPLGWGRNENEQFAASLVKLPVAQTSTPVFTYPGIFAVLHMNA